MRGGIPKGDGQRSKRYDKGEYDGPRLHWERRDLRGGYEVDDRQKDDTPVLHKIYDARMTGIKDFDAFLTSTA